VIGSTLGLTTGLLLSRYADASRRRMLFVDLGALAGAAVPWALIYPLISDDQTNNDEQAAGLISTLTLGGGAVVAWLLTRGGDRTMAADDEETPTALLQRSRTGSWKLGTPGLRPMQAPALAPPSGLALGIDLAAGRF
jgi:hypothetical protein